LILDFFKKILERLEFSDGVGEGYYGPCVGDSLDGVDHVQHVPQALRVLGDHLQEDVVVPARAQLRDLRRTLRSQISDVEVE